ncbi:FkbM family methyltransferase [Denitratisoma sp. agr-D3]
MSSLILNNPHRKHADEEARRFCDGFIALNGRPKYVLGRNAYAEAVSKHIAVTGFIDDFSDQESYLACPVIKTKDIPQDALVLIASSLRPLSAQRRLEERQVQYLDYFAFRRISGLPLPHLMFNEGFAEDFAENEKQYEWIYQLLADEQSRTIFRKLISFRVEQDISFLEGFEPREDQQYFEDFLQLQDSGETFIDVGGYDGYTSSEFIRHCPHYAAIHIFEPEPKNYTTCKTNLQHHANIDIHKLGLSDRKATLRLSSEGSASKVSASGHFFIDVDRLDNYAAQIGNPTLIKIDVEGAEMSAIGGAAETIRKHHPRLAICVYHNPGDFWKIPKFILEINPNYLIHLRHYTESIYETVMFFTLAPTNNTHLLT